ncbi:ribonuclease J [Candidatus Phytoplasma melaleucae]|uniref:Ribonuclease J n=1 Tax=Candidatus Phytoplasma melaleucae TaxID=2982630 RepID=A0ABT9DF98_9MOLU|nr:ribonuclease J ['Melaleuca sp.' phytoplasma]MDO8167906.1 ribonuclease J ['Melaleuca sp.' phytoplasma]
MQEISFFALGGMGENGKNFYLLKIQSSYFVLDAGLKYPSLIMNGIDAIIPYYSKLEFIKDKIKGIFITSSLDTHSGALSYVIEYLNVPVYAANFTIEVLKHYLKQKNIDDNKVIFQVVHDQTQIKLDDIKIHFFSISHFLPGVFGIAFETVKGIILYMSAMNLLQSKNKSFQTNFKYLAELSQKKVLALLPASQGVLNITTLKKEDILEYDLSSYFASIEKNIIISFLIPDLLKIQMVIDLAVEANLKIVILGRKSEKIIDIALQQKYLRIPDNFLVNLKKASDYLKYQNLVVIVVGKRFEPFYRLQRMCKQTDRLMRLNKLDKILLFSIDFAGIDKIQNKTIDMLARNGFMVDVLVKDLLQTFSYNYEDNFRLMLNLLNPTFIIPVMGEYRHQYQVKKIAQNFNYPVNKIFLLENGDIWSYDGKNKPLIKKKFFKNLGDILIDGTPVLDGNDFILKDRELLANDGIIIVVCNLDMRLRKIIGNIELISKGFLSKIKIDSLLMEIKDLFVEISKNFLNNNRQIKWSDFKNNLREELSKFVFKETKKKPVIIPVLISVIR